MLNSYHHFYLGSKGNQFKNKSVLIEAIHKMKQEKIREKQLAEQREARRQKNVVRKEKRINKKLEVIGAIKRGPVDQKEVLSQPLKKEEPHSKDVKGKSPVKTSAQQVAKGAPEGSAPKKVPEVKVKGQAKPKDASKPKKGEQGKK